MPIRVRCTCGKEYSVKDELAGKKLRCKTCGTVVPVRSPSKSAVAATARPKSKTTSPDDDFGDDLDDADFASLGSTTAPKLPPRRSTAKREVSPPIAAGRTSAATGGDTLEERIASRTAEEVEANTKRAPWKELASAVGFFLAGAACYYYLDTKEQAGGLVRLPWILAAVYMAIGKLGVLAICWTASLISFLLAALAFTGAIQIYHAED